MKDQPITKLLSSQDNREWRGQVLCQRGIRTLDSDVTADEESYNETCCSCSVTVPPRDTMSFFWVKGHVQEFLKQVCDS